MTKLKARQPSVHLGDVPLIDSTSDGTGISLRNPNSETVAGTIYSSVTAWCQKALDDFETARDDILVVERPAPEVNVVEISAGHVHEYRASITRRTIDDHVKLGLAEIGIECRVLNDDIIELAASFLNQFQRRVANLRIEVVDTRSCPKFHCDNVNIRLVTTYLGLSTEYQFVGDAAIHATPLCSLVFMKGHKHHTHSDRALHRSPDVLPGTKRLFLAIDF